MTHALVRRDVTMHDDPLRAQSLSLAVGGVLATLVVAAGVVLGLVRPQGVPESASIVMGRETGALYVRVDDTLHPVPNLASARLIARAPADPVAAKEAAIADAKRGPLMGIPGAPAVIGDPLHGEAWTVCDDDRTVVAVGPSPLDGTESTRPVLVTPRGAGNAATYLMYEGQRAAVDLRSIAVVRALRLDGVVPVPISPTLLDVVPEVPAIAAPAIPGAGSRGAPGLGGATIGSIVLVQGTDAAERYVVLRDGLQLVGEVAADLIRYTYDSQAGPLPVVAPTAIAALPIVRTLPTGTFPSQARTPVGAADGPAVCAQWRAGGSARTSSNTVVLVGDSANRSWGRVTTLAQADGDGPNIDAVAIPGGVSAYVRSATIVGDDGTTGTHFLVTDAGVTFGVHDDETAKALGLEQLPDPAPWPILAALPRGPELSVAAASILRDGLPAPS